jgi:Recombination endonuclease VII
MNTAPTINSTAQSTRARRLAAGVCATCGERPLATKYSCAECAERAAEYAREFRAKRRAAFIAEHGADGRTLRAKAVPIQTTRRCSKCESYFPIGEFGWNDKKTERRKHVCKKCDSKRVDNWNKTHPTERAKVYRVRHLKRTFGITPAEYDRQLAVQGGKCAICGKPEQESRHQKLCIDHNHVTRQLRALLCFSCNVAIGMFEDNPVRLEKAAAYIREHS